MSDTPVHFVPLPALEERNRDMKAIVATCGAINPACISTQPRLVDCPRCRAAMLPEEVRG